MFFGHCFVAKTGGIVQDHVTLLRQSHISHECGLYLLAAVGSLAVRFKGRGKLCSLVKVNSSGQGSHSVSIPLHASISSSSVLFTSFHMWYGIAWLKLGMIAQIGGWSSTPYSNRDSYVHS